MSFRTTGGIAGVEKGLDLQQNAVGEAYQVLLGQRTEGDGRVPAALMTDIRAAADALFSLGDKGDNGGAGLVNYFILRRNGPRLELYETNRPTRLARKLIALLEQAHAIVLEPRPDRRLIYGVRCFPTGCPYYIRPKGPWSGKTAAGSTRSPVNAKVWTGNTGVAPKFPVKHHLGNVGTVPKFPVRHHLGNVRTVPRYPVKSPIGFVRKWK